MSAFPLAAQDAAGALSLAARKAPSIAASDADVSSDFDAALAQSAAALPTLANGGTSTVDAASAKAANPESWRERVDGADAQFVSLTADNPAVSAVPPAGSALPMTASVSVVTGGDRIEQVLAGFSGRAAQASPPIAAPPEIAPPPPEKPAPKAVDAREPPLTDATRASAAAPPSVGLASGQIAAAALASRLKPSGEATRQDASAGASVTRGAPQATFAEPLCAQTAPLDAGLASLVAASAVKMEAAAPAALGDQDAVARIGAALVAAKATRGATDASVKAATRDASAEEGTSVAVHVVAQGTWLQPVSPAFSSGLNALAGSDHAALAPSRDAASGFGAGEGATAASGERAATPPASLPETPPQPASGGVIESQPPAGAPLNAAPVAPAIGRAANVASLVADAARGPAPAPRRDLEIALTPKDLGGLAIHVKSVGDRLEIAFVADKGETARLISDGSAALATQLNDAGLGLGGVDISAVSAQGGGSGAPHSDGGASNGAFFGGRAGAESRQPSPEFTGRDRQERNHESGQQTSDSRAPGDRGLFL